MRARWSLAFLLFIAACKRQSEEPDQEKHEKAKPSPAKVEGSEEPESNDDPAPPSANPDPTRPRYLRKDRRGNLVDAFRFRSVPASIVEQEVGAASSRADVAGVLRRFGLNALEGNTGEVWIAKASLVDALDRERILVASFRGEADEAGARDENDWIVFLGSTKEDRVLAVGAAKINTKASTAVDVDARQLHSKEVVDVIATWSSCGGATKACHSLRAWTMQRGHPELVADVSGERPPAVTGSSAPHGIVVDDRVLTFDEQSFSYK